MDHLHFAYPYLFYFFIPALLIVLTYKLYFYKAPVYRYPLTRDLAKTKHVTKKHSKTILLLIRSALLCSLVFFIARPQWVDSRSKVNVEGVDIILALDVSGSMQCFDDLQDHRLRIDVAKAEALHFVEKRTDDPIGLVIFGADAISRAPLTLDKNILKNIIQDLHLGIIDPNGTSLATGLATSINKLRHSKAKSKIIILLTDGRPTPQTEKITIQTALSLLKQNNIKVYTIAIGNKKGAYIKSAFGMVQQLADNVDESLLKTIAKETNGKFFRANKPAEMKTIYNTIDKLEKTKYQTNIFSRYYEAFASFLWILLFLLFADLLGKFLIWKSI